MERPAKCYKKLNFSTCFQVQFQNSPFSRGVCHSTVEVLYWSFLLIRLSVCYLICIAYIIYCLTYFTYFLTYFTYFKLNVYKFHLCDYCFRERLHDFVPYCICPIFNYLGLFLYAAHSYLLLCLLYYVLNVLSAPPSRFFFNPDV